MKKLLSTIWISMLATVVLYCGVVTVMVITTPRVNNDMVYLSNYQPAHTWNGNDWIMQYTTPLYIMLAIIIYLQLAQLNKK